MICVVICSKPHSLRQTGKCEVCIHYRSLQAITRSREISVAIPIAVRFPWDPWKFQTEAHL